MRSPNIVAFWDKKVLALIAVTRKLFNLAQIRYCTKEEARALCPTSDLSMLADGASVRVVKIAGGWCPCGGTHIESLVGEFYSFIHSPIFQSRFE